MTFATVKRQTVRVTSESPYGISNLKRASTGRIHFFPFFFKSFVKFIFLESLRIQKCLREFVNDF